MRRRGVYVLFLRFDDDVETEAGALGHICLPAGDYCYVGSAMGGLDLLPFPVVCACAAGFPVL